MTVKKLFAPWQKISSRIQGARARGRDDKRKIDGKTGDRNLFIGYCWGSAGSAWLARLLNSHEDVLCLHIPDFPKLNYRNYDDLVTILDSIVFTTNDWVRAYSLIGFTHGIQGDWHERLQERYGEHLRGFILTRHPIKRIQSSFALNKINVQRESDEFWQEPFRGIYEHLTRVSGKRFPDDFAALGFYWSCHLVGSILAESELKLPIYKMENLTSQVESVNELLSYVSDGVMRHLEENVFERMQNKVVAKHAKGNLSVAETYASWNDIYKEAYHYLVRPEILKAYSELGYTFPHQI
jgi:hypothetical protein